ncbi:MAG: TatD family hydrolase [Chitinispirillia bacterium]|nr:TatD family hydrolase [Chitinispirillia bacterium]
MIMNSAWIDVHAHLYSLCNNTPHNDSHSDLEDTIADSVSCGVDLIINTAVSIETARIVLEQCRAFPNHLRAAVGISPFYINNHKDEIWIEQLKEMVGNPLTAAVGEIGLDCTNPTYPPLIEQTPFFEKQLALAIQTKTTAIVHSRGMEKQTAQICRSMGAANVIFHCFTGDREAAEYIIESGYYISVSGIITYKNSHLRDLIPTLPINRLLIETDSPYLAPAPHRGKKNNPAMLVHTAKETAGILKIEESHLSKILSQNFVNAINKPIPFGHY